MPARKLQTEYHRMEIISGFFRPMRSASHPELTAPTSRSHKVIVKTAVTAINGTPKLCEIGTMISRKIVKSNASRVQPSHAATQASHCSFVGSFHHGTVTSRAIVASMRISLIVVFTVASSGPHRRQAVT
jgi:hypothetical protein